MSGGGAVVAWPLFQEEGGGSIPTSPLQLTLGEIPIKKAQQLNAEWHSVLPKTNYTNLLIGGRATCYGASYDGRFYAVAIWTNPIAANRLKDGDRLLELRRLAICGDAPKNTASRMLAVMRRLLVKKFPDVIRLISYQAEDFHAGTIYKAAGWKAANRAEFVTWVNPKRGGKSAIETQIESAKVRWELSLF